MTSDILYQTFTLTGTEEVAISSSNQQTVSVNSLRDFIIKELKKDLQLNLVDNTTDENKPMSIPQSVYIESRLTAVENKLEQLTNTLFNFMQQQGSLPTTP